jgi:hypothetical protein
MSKLRLASPYEVEEHTDVEDGKVGEVADPRSPFREQVPVAGLLKPRGHLSGLAVLLVVSITLAFLEGPPEFVSLEFEDLGLLGAGPPLLF